MIRQFVDVTDRFTVLYHLEYTHPVRAKRCIDIAFSNVTAQNEGYEGIAEKALDAP